MRKYHVYWGPHVDGVVEDILRRPSRAGLPRRLGEFFVDSMSYEKSICLPVISSYATPKGFRALQTLNNARLAQCRDIF